MANYPFEKMLICTHLEEGGEAEKVYALYTHLNVDNYGWFLEDLPPEYLFFKIKH